MVVVGVVMEVVVVVVVVVVNVEELGMSKVTGIKAVDVIPKRIPGVVVGVVVLNEEEILVIKVHFLLQCKRQN